MQYKTGNIYIEYIFDYINEMFGLKSVLCNNVYEINS